jgi:hypothetical protein
VTVVRASPWVADERLDDVVMAINLETGAYYVLDGAASDCWTLAARGADIGDLVDALTARYDVDCETVRRDAAAFVTSLVEEGLLTTDGAAGTEAGNGVEPTPIGQDGEKRPYRAPVVQRYDDLDDLLLLDPIHEVDDAGWPIARAD